MRIFILFCILYKAKDVNDMHSPKVERLLINYKTLEEFKNFTRYGAEELSMLEDLEANIIENNSESPFYGIYYGGSLVARMSLYKKEPNEHTVFQKPYIELFKLEVLPAFQKQQFGKTLVNFAKQLQFPIKTIARVQSAQFWEKLQFEKVTIDDGDFYIWQPRTNLNAVTKSESA